MLPDQTGTGALPLCRTHENRFAPTRAFEAINTMLKKITMLETTLAKS